MLIGAGGVDTVRYAAAAAGVTVNLSVTTAQNTVGAGLDTLSGFENLSGSAFNDVGCIVSFEFCCACTAAASGGSSV